MAAGIMVVAVLLVVGRIPSGATGGSRTTSEGGRQEGRTPEGGAALQPNVPGETIPLSAPTQLETDPDVSPGPVSSPDTPPTEKMREYALSADRLGGLPPGARPGTRFEVWVAWDPSLTGAPKVQRLLPLATLVKIVPGVTPGAPAAAILSVPASKIPRLLYGEKFGELTVTLFP